MAHSNGTSPQLKLPVLIFGIVEVRRLKRELESLEDYLRQAAIRDPGKQPPLPRVSRLLEAVAADNSLQLLQAEHRVRIGQFLEYIEHEAPNLHMSFAADPSSAFRAKLVTWLRANIHPHTLLEVGLQPTIAAGCIVRTNNKVFDFSLRERFADAAGLLVSSLEAAGAAVVPAVAVEAPARPAGAAAPVVAPAAAVPARPAPAVTPVENVAAQLAAATGTPVSLPANQEARQ